MISVIVIWLYMLLTCYVIGFSCMKLVTGKEVYCCQKQTSYIYAGIAIVTVYSQLFSIFGKVSFAANLILLLVCILCIAIFRKDLQKSLSNLRLTITPGKAAVFVLLFLLFAYGSSTGIDHYDTGLYHAQSIRWIEEYGIIPGLGNLHSRLAYNSAAFALSALYSMSFLGGQSFHCCVGFLAWLLSLVCTEALQKGRGAKPKLSDIARLIGIYYLLNTFDEMISPASDYFMVLLVLYIVIRWLDLNEKAEKSYVPYALLSVLCVSVITIKLSGALLLLLVLKPAFLMIKQQKGKEIAKYLNLGLLTIIPYFLRNIILSGWLVYPFTAIDLFSFDFKIPEGMAEYDSREIQVWGRGISDVKRYGETIDKWLPDWIYKLDGTDKVFFLLAVSGLLLLLLFIVYAVIKKKKEMADPLLVIGTMSACFLFWLSSAPLIRYGCVFLWLGAVLPWGYLYLKISPHMDRYKIYYIALCLIGVYKLFMFGLETGREATTQYFILQKDYEKFDNVAYDLHGYTFYYPVEGDRTGYDVFPASPMKAEDIFRGETIQQGFKDVIHEKSE